MSTLEKKPSITEDLRVKDVVPTPASKVEEPSLSAKQTPVASVATESKKPLEQIKEGESFTGTSPPNRSSTASSVTPTEKLSTRDTPTKSFTTNTTINNSSSNINNNNNNQSKKTFTEITQELKKQLKETTNEIEKSDTEFNRLVGNLEKKIEALRIQLDSSN